MPACQQVSIAHRRNTSPVQVPASEVISFESSCPHTQAHTHLTDCSTTTTDVVFSNVIRCVFSQEDPFEPILRQLSEPPSASAVAASQSGKQGSYFRRQASLPFPGDAQGQTPAATGDRAAGVAPTAADQRGAGVVERLVPDYDWEQDVMTGAVFDYHFANVAGLASVVGDQQVRWILHCCPHYLSTQRAGDK